MTLVPERVTVIPWGETRRRVAIIGSTGSVGNSTLEVIRRFPERFEVTALVARNNAAALGRQMTEFRPRYVGLVDEAGLADLRQLRTAETELVGGEAACAALAGLPEVDIVVAAAVGFRGIRSVAAALRAGKTVALANKESVVAAGGLLRELLGRHGGRIIPVDSEHSALFQLLLGEDSPSVLRLTLTASGGPFLKTPIEELPFIRPAEAVRHPKWNMGAKISIDSATMMNKGLELLEAHWLLGVPATSLDVVIHPQSLVHSLVQFVDGTQFAHLSVPDMQGPIAFGLGVDHPRLGGVMRPLDLSTVGTLEFLPVDHRRFPAVRLALECVGTGDRRAAVFTVADEIAVDRFVRGELTFDRIVPFVADAVERWGGGSCTDEEELLALESELFAAADAARAVMG